MATPLQGASFELRDSNGAVLRSGISGADGMVDLGNVSPGTYSLVETAAPASFLIGGPYTVVVAADGSITIDGTALADFEAPNLPYPNVTFLKTDANAAAFAGAVFELSDQAGTTLQATSTATGIVAFPSIAPGTYTLTETSAPFGYIADTTPYTVVVAENGDITVNGNPIDSFSVENAAGPALTFLKVNSTPV